VDRLAQAVAQARPDVVHFMGHGRFDPGNGTGALALVDPEPGGRYEWIDERRVAAAMCPDGGAPRVVVLHTCEGGRADTTFRFAGLAPELISRGVQCVVAMQYPIRNDTASRFSTALYTALATGAQLDEAVQACRNALVSPSGKDPHLVGVPVLYQHRADPVLAHPTATGGDMS
jgi:CHAT domain-containing protein